MPSPASSQVLPEQGPSDQMQRRAAALDAADPLAAFAGVSCPAPHPALKAYLDGNSLGRPLTEVAATMDHFIRNRWGTRLIQGWTDEWMDWPTEVGNQVVPSRRLSGTCAGPARCLPVSPFKAGWVMPIRSPWARATRPIKESKHF